jgi:TonB family protein
MLAEITVTPYRNLMEAVTIYGRDFTGSVEQTISSSNVIILIYLAGLLVFLGLFVFRLSQVLLLIHYNKVQKIGLVKFVYIKKDFSPFSFMSYIFVNPEKKIEAGYDKMVAHEMEHIKQGHTFDVLILEIMTVFQWFNPFMWILRRVIRENHEYLADQAVLKAGISPAQYKHLLLNQAVGFQLEIANNFNSSLIKKRIKMISKMQTSKYGKLKILLGLLVIFSLITAFSLEEKTSVIKNNEKALVLDLVDNIARNAEELQYIKGVVENSKSNQAALDKLKENYKLDYHYGVYTVSWKRDYENGIFFVDGKESNFEEIKKLEADGKRGTVVGIPDFEEKPFFEKYGDKAKNGINLVYSEIDYKELFPIETPVPATKLTVQEVLDKYYKTEMNPKSNSSGDKIIVNVDGKQLQISGINVSLDEVSKLFMCNDKYNMAIIRESNTINLFPAKSIAKETSLTSDGEPIYFMVEEMPEFPGGEMELRKFIANSIQYPEVAMKNGIKGKVYVTFVVGKDGTVKDAKIARGVDPSLDAEALRVVSALPKWKPGVQRGEAVNVSYTVPINFALE